VGLFLSTTKRILGVVTSLRPGGNSEMLTRVALRAAAGRGAGVELVSLRDLRLTFCEGCLSCVYRGGGCKKEDDVFWLYETVSRYDGLILASPTYLLGAPAQVKALIDRGVAALAVLPGRPEIPTGTITVAGLPGWDYFAPPVVNQLGLLLGGRLVGSLTAYAPGPGEVLLDDDLIRRTEELARAVLEDRPVPTPEGVCPVCRLPRGESARQGPCPFCRHDPARPDALHRFSRESLTEFVTDWMLPSRERFLANREDIKRRRVPVLETELPVLRPERLGDPE
jgi:hypothetical protein